jgi:arylsulfatase
MSNVGCRWLAGSAGSSDSQRAEETQYIVVIMGDDIGIWNIGAYHRSMMAGRTPAHRQAFARLKALMGPQQ